MTAHGPKTPGPRTPGPKTPGTRTPGATARSAGAPTAPIEDVFGTLGLVGLSAFSVAWALDEVDVGNRGLLWSLATVMLALAIWRGAMTVTGLIDRFESRSSHD